MDDKKRTARYWMAFLILAVFLVILFVWNVNAGSIHLSVGEILNIIFRHQGDATAYNIIWEIRLPRILSVIILGGALSVSGFLLQTFFNNPIAGPFVLGISSGANTIFQAICCKSNIKIVTFFQKSYFSIIPRKERDKLLQHFPIFIKRNPYFSKNMGSFFIYFILFI